ncbi:MAG: hypothetical protein GKS05_02855 [Nitrospirales bacterium]|nr:hypothetical protein [Nitrospirales bacterium]
MHGKLLTRTITDLRQVFQSALELDQASENKDQVDDKVLSCLDESLDKEIKNAQKKNLNASERQNLERLHENIRRIGANLCLSELKNVKVQRQTSASKRHTFDAKVKEGQEGFIELEFLQSADWKIDPKQFPVEKAVKFVRKVKEAKKIDKTEDVTPTKKKFKVLYEEFTSLPFGESLLNSLDPNTEEQEEYIRWALILSLNQILGNPFMYSNFSQRSDVTFSEKVKGLSKQKFKPEILEELNRRILEEAFPTYIRNAVGLSVSFPVKRTGST